MDIRKAFEAAFIRMREKNWEKIYIAVDIHDTILRACYDDEETYDYLPSAKEVLQMISLREDICLILWSSCHRDKLAEYARHFLDDGIKFDYVNENPEVENTRLQNFDEKLYMNVGLDDKFGFDGETDWEVIRQVLEEYPVSAHEE
ncbi:MAG: hypothetical protein J5637_08430 [Prevotella sp.]|nr:hypothetical protein [Prevotella sp.]